MEERTISEQIEKLKSLVTEKRDEILARRLISNEIGFSTNDLLNEKMYIEPQSDIKVSGLLHDYIIGNPFKKILIQADGGVGKSTLLAKVYTELADNFMKGSSTVCPLYYNLSRRELLPTPLRKIIGGIVSNYDCCQYVILIDGLDEIKNTDADSMDEFFNSDIFTEHRTIVACRKIFIQENAISKRFDEIITLYDYRDNEEKQLEMVKKFCDFTKTEKAKKAKMTEINDEKREKIKEYIKHEKKPGPLQNPLILGVFLLGMQEGDVPKESMNAGEILDRCARDIIKREYVNRKHEHELFEPTEDEIEETNKSITTIFHKISIANWKIYKSQASKKDIDYDDITEKGDTPESKLINTCLGFFVSRTNEVNEVIFDYFCAKYMLFVFIGEIEDELDLFSIGHIKVEIKRFAFNDFMEKKQKKMAFKYLKKKYKQFNDSDYLRFMSLINFFPHIKEENKGKLFLFLLYECIKLRNKDIYNAQRNLIKHCIFQAGIIVITPWLEKRYYKQMLSNSKFDSFVRGGYLLYYAKSLPKDFKHPYFDERRPNGKFSDWDRLFFEGFKNHIDEDRGKKDKHKKRRYVRRLEFRVAKQFIEDRKKVAPEVVEFYESLKKNNEEDYDFKTAVKEEYFSLIETINKYKNV